MTQQDYYYAKASQDKIYSDLQHEAKINLLTEQWEYNLFAMLKPKVSIDGNQYCVLYGEDLQCGIAGFGDTLYLAIIDFNKQFNQPLPFINLKK